MVTATNINAIAPNSGMNRSLVCLLLDFSNEVCFMIVCIRNANSANEKTNSIVKKKMIRAPTIPKMKVLTQT